MRTINGYLLEKELSKGGTASVWLATKASATWAFKLLSEEPNPALQKQWKEIVVVEAGILRQLDHPNIVKMHEYNADCGQPLYLALEFMPNGTLFDAIKASGAFPEEVARFCFIHILEAMDHVHARGYAHRDIKPENILLDGDHVPKLADFGYASAFVCQDGRQLIEGCQGTPGYRAAEVLTCHHYDGAKSDLFALGVVLFNMVTGLSPFRRAEGSDDRYRHLCTSPAAYWTEISKWTPRGVPSEDCKELLMSLLAHDPLKRPSVIKVKASKWCRGPTQALKEHVLAQKAASLCSTKHGFAYAVGGDKAAASRYGYAPHRIQHKKT